MSNLQVRDPNLSIVPESTQLTRDGYSVDGSYQIMPDGTIIVTEYYADSTGYHSTVRQIDPVTGETTVLYQP
jgi:hypothetical protein